jgi:hypothetical protein
MKLFTVALLIVASTAHADTGGGQFTGLGIARVTSLVETYFAGKTLRGEDGTVKTAAAVRDENGRKAIAFHTVQPDGTVTDTTTYFGEEGGRVIAVEASGTRYVLGIKASSGNYLAVPETPTEFGFIEQECSLQAGKTLCVQTFHNEDGTLTTYSLHEISL